MIIEENKVLKLRGTKVIDITHGYGTFLNIFSKSDGDIGTLNLWIYLCKWAITDNGTEILSSDSGDDITSFDFGDLFDKDSFYTEIAVIDEEELHLVFSNGIVIEIWEEDNLYGDHSEMLVLFRDGVVITTVFNN